MSLQGFHTTVKAYENIDDQNSRHRLRLQDSDTAFALYIGASAHEQGRPRQLLALFSVINVESGEESLHILEADSSDHEGMGVSIRPTPDIKDGFEEGKLLAEGVHKVKIEVDLIHAPFAGHIGPLAIEAINLDEEVAAAQAHDASLLSVAA